MDANVAERYAESLYQLALEDHALEGYLADMKLVDTVLESNPEFEKFFSMTESEREEYINSQLQN